MDDSKEDLLLSQALDAVENGNLNCFNVEDDLMLSQALDNIERNELAGFCGKLSDSQISSMVMDIKDDEFGCFDISLPECDQNASHDVANPSSSHDVANPSNSARFVQAVSEEDMDDLVKGQRFVVEARKQNGDNYPPKTLYNLVCGILRRLREEGIYDRNFLDEKSHRFARFRTVLDAHMKYLTSIGLDVPQKQAPPVTVTDEEELWKTVFGDNDALSLQYTVYFYNCKLFGLRGCDEHRDLETNQFEIGIDNTGRYIKYVGKNCKTYKGGLKHRVDPKVVHLYDVQSKIVPYYEKYLKAVGEGPFYKRPLAPEGMCKLRYSNQVVGVNRLKTFMRDMTSRAGLKGEYTNHSGKRTCATELYRQGVPEEEIMKRTGHRSILGVRNYQKASTDMLVDISNKLNPPQCNSADTKENIDTNASASGAPLNDVSECSPKNFKTIDLGTRECNSDNSASTRRISDIFNGQSNFSNCVFKF